MPVCSNQLKAILCALLSQDVHWSAGLFGYFPTYTLGAMYACQLYQHAASQIPDLEQQVAAGNFKPLKVRGVQAGSDVGPAAFLVACMLGCMLHGDAGFSHPAVGIL